jgi:DNA-binding FrmR family transcriptional regulator
MVDDGVYCIDIITQIQAVQSALGAVSRRILQKHLEHCVSDAIAGGSRSETQAKIEELVKVMRRSCK